MIFDRTEKDVSSAKEIIENKVKRFLPLSEDELEILERGTMTIGTISRIERKQEELKGLINSMGYWNTPIENKSFSSSDIFDAEELKRLFFNAKTLCESFFFYPTTPKNSAARYYYKNINALERSLHDVESIAAEVVKNYRYCGDTECGGAT